MTCTPCVHPDEDYTHSLLSREINTRRPNIRRNRTAQTIKQIAHIILRRNPWRIQFVPIHQHIAHDRPTRDVDVLNTRPEALLVRVEQVEDLRLRRRRAVEVRRRAHDGDAGEVEQTGECAAEEGLERCVVFLLRRAVGAQAVGEEERIVCESVAEDRAGPVDVGGAGVALDHGGWGGRWRVAVSLAVGGCGGGVVEGGQGGEVDEAGAQVGVEFEGFGAVDCGGVVDGVGRVGEVGVLRKVA